MDVQESGIRRKSAGGVDSTMIWQGSADYPDAGNITPSVDPALLQATEPALPNIVKSCPYDPDLDYLFTPSNNGSADVGPPSNLSLHIATERSPSGQQSNIISPGHRAKSVPSRHIQKSAIQGLSKEVAATAFSDIPLRLSAAVHSFSSPNGRYSQLGKGEGKKNYSGKANKADDPSFPFKDNGDPVNAWTDLSWPQQRSVLSWTMSFMGEIADLLLSVVYLATYNVGCYALVTPLEGGTHHAYTMLYLALAATAVGYLLFAWKLQLLRTSHVDGKSHWLTTISRYSRLEWESLCDNHINKFKILELAKLLFKDSVMSCVVTANLGPKDNNIITITKLVLSAQYLARFSTHLFLIVILQLFRRCCVRADFHHSTLFAVTRHTFSLLTFALWLTLPMVIFLYPEIPRHIYVTSSYPEAASLYVLCVPPPPSVLANQSPAQISNFCNPSVCLNNFGRFVNHTSYFVPNRTMHTFSDGYICAMRQLSTRRVQPGVYDVAMPGMTLAARLHTHMPCQLPLNANGTRLPSDQWTENFYLPYYTSSASSTATPANYYSHIRTLNPVVYQNYTPWIHPGIPHRYMHADSIRRATVCTRSWSVMTNLYGYMDLEKGGLLLPEELNAPYQTYTVLLEITQFDESVGPLSCSFDYVGFVRRSVERVAGREQALSHGKDTKALRE